jgi:hypothetical protein
VRVWAIVGTEGDDHQEWKSLSIMRLNICYVHSSGPAAPLRHLGANAPRVKTVPFKQKYYRILAFECGMWNGSKPIVESSGTLARLQ